MQNYQFNFFDDKTGLSVHINGERFDASGVGEFKSALEKVWNEKIRKVRIDFSKVEFIDSSGVGALLSVQKRMKTGSEPIVLCKSRPNVISVIELLRLHRVFTLEG